MMEIDDIEFGGWSYGYSKIINAWDIFRIFVKMPTSLLCEHEIVEWGFTLHLSFQMSAWVT
jgi:hypothetical protein